MVKFANIVCKTVGIAGASAILYDAYSVAKNNSKRVEQKAIADSFERIHASTRTVTNESYVKSAMQDKVTELRQNNTVIPLWGRIRGFIGGGLSSLGSHIIPTCFACLAIGTKGFMSKLGAIGLGFSALNVLLKEGFGIGKFNPMK